MKSSSSIIFQLILFLLFLSYSLTNGDSCQHHVNEEEEDSTQPACSTDQINPPPHHQQHQWEAKGEVFQSAIALHDDVIVTKMFSYPKDIKTKSSELKYKGVYTFPYFENLPTGLVPGSKIEFMMYFQEGSFSMAIHGLFGDLLFYCVVLPDENQITVKDFFNGKWGEEIKGKPFNFEPHSPTSISIVAKKKYFQLEIESNVIARLNYRATYPLTAAFQFEFRCLTHLFCARLINNFQLVSIPETKLFNPETILQENIFSKKQVQPPINSENTQDKKSILLFIGVVTAPHYFERRSAIRNSWMKANEVMNGNVLVRFFIGATQDDYLNQLCKIENEIYNDIIFLPEVQEDYHAITNKTLGVFEYGLNLNAKFIMKSDDDTFVHVERMASMLSSKKKKKGLYIGKIAWNAGPIRYNDHKWYMSYEDFPGQMYPPFAFGPGYVISRDVAEHIISLKNEKKLKVLLFFKKKKDLL